MDFAQQEASLFAMIDVQRKTSLNTCTNEVEVPNMFDVGWCLILRTIAEFAAMVKGAIILATVLWLPIFNVVFEKSQRTYRNSAG